MKKVLIVIILTTFFAAGAANAVPPKSRHCQADGILEFNDWNTAMSSVQTMVDGSKVRSMPHKTDTVLLVQTTFTLEGVTLCVQKEVLKND